MVSESKTLFFAQNQGLKSKLDVPDFWKIIFKNQTQQA